MLISNCITLNEDIWTEWIKLTDKLDIGNYYTNQNLYFKSYSIALKHRDRILLLSRKWSYPMMGIMGGQYTKISLLETMCGLTKYELNLLCTENIEFFIKNFSILLPRGSFRVARLKNLLKGIKDLSKLISGRDNYETYSLPSGRKLVSENILDAALRELNEETGINIHRDMFESEYHLFKRKFTSMMISEEHVVYANNVFVIETHNAIPDMKLSDEYNGFKWINREEVDEIEPPNVRDLLKQIFNSDIFGKDVDNVSNMDIDDI